MTTPSDPRQPETPTTATPAAAAEEAVTENSGTLNVYGENRTQTVARDVPNLNKRPPEMWAGAVFLTLAALPLLILGGGLAVLPGQFGTNLRDKLSSSGTAIGADTLVLVFRVGGVVLLLVGLLLIWLAWTAVKPKRRARIGATVLAAIVVVGLAIVMIVTALDPVSVGVLLLAVAGVVLLFLPRSEEFMYTAR